MAAASTLVCVLLPGLCRGCQINPHLSCVWQPAGQQLPSARSLQLLVRLTGSPTLNQGSVRSPAPGIVAARLCPAAARAETGGSRVPEPSVAIKDQLPSKGLVLQQLQVVRA